MGSTCLLDPRCWTQVAWGWHGFNMLVRPMSFGSDLVARPMAFRPGVVVRSKNLIIFIIINIIINKFEKKILLLLKKP